jgi:hypothetical protein
MLVRNDKRARDRINSRRFRIRQARHQHVYQVTADDEQLIDKLAREGYLRDDVVHSHEQIEQALTLWVADECQK